MAKGVGERPSESVGGVLTMVDYPASSDEIVRTAGDEDAPADVINFLKCLPAREYRDRDDVERQLAEADARFGLYGAVEHHRGDIGKEATEPSDRPPPSGRP